MDRRFLIEPEERRGTRAERWWLGGRIVMARPPRRRG